MTVYFGQNFIFVFTTGVVVGVMFTKIIDELNVLSESAGSGKNQYSTEASIKCDKKKLDLEHHTPLSVDGSYIIDDAVAQNLVKNVKIVCWVTTYPANHHIAMHIKRTWGTRCNKLIFISTQNDTELGAVGLENVKEGHTWLWAKTRAGVRYIYENHLEDGDWFLKADDDTYVIMENLRFLLSSYDAGSPLYFGCRLKSYDEKRFGNDGYMSGGAGYVLSKEALTRLAEISLPNQKYCSSANVEEDLGIAGCLKNVGVKFVDTRDNLGRHRFHPLKPEQHAYPDMKKVRAWIYYPQQQGMNCCSGSAISFHYITPPHMYGLEYILYHLRPYGISYLYSHQQEIQRHVVQE